MRLACLPFLLLATPALAEVDIRQIVIDAARTSDCMLTEETAEATFPLMGLTQDQVGPVVEEMRLAGEADVIEGVLHLSPDLCSGAQIEGEAPTEAMVELPPVSPLMVQVIAVFRDNGCSMTEAEGMPALTAAGISEDQLDSLNPEIEALMAAGLVQIDDSEGRVTFADALCQGATASDDMADPAAPLIQMLSENGCALTQADAEPLLGEYGLTSVAADEMADSLMDRGLAVLEGEALVLQGCTP